MVTRGICIQGLPKYIWEAIVGEGLACKTTIYTPLYRLIARCFIRSSLHLRKEPCCCITSVLKHTPSIVYNSTVALSQCAVKHIPHFLPSPPVYPSPKLRLLLRRKSALLHVGYAPIALIWFPQQPNFNLHILPPFSSKSHPNIYIASGWYLQEAIGTYNPVCSYCR